MCRWFDPAPGHHVSYNTIAFDCRKHVDSCLKTPHPAYMEWFSKVEHASTNPPQAWDEETDIIIIGAGGAGIAAALQALENGDRVIAVEKYAPGGATRASGGVIYAGGGTNIQKAANVEDDPDNMFAYLKQETQHIVKAKTLRAFCEQSAANLDWLQRYGVKFDSTYYPSKTSYPAPEYYLYHSDNSLLPAFQHSSKPAARGHRGYVPLKQGRKAINLGNSIFDPLLAAAQKQGLILHDYSEARQLILHNGRVMGVKLRRFTEPQLKENYIRIRQKAQRLMQFWPPILPGGNVFRQRGLKLLAQAQHLEKQRKDIYIRTHKAVVLAAGGFSFNRKMMQHYAPDYAAGFPLGTDGDDGAGIHLGLSAGGQIGNMHRASAWRFINPPLSFSHGVIINEKGMRFMNESEYGARLGCEIAENQNGKAWLILDRALVKQSLAEVKGNRALPFQRDLARLNIWFAATKAKTLPALASKINIDPQILSNTIAAYNRGEDAFDKDPADMKPLHRPPFYAIPIGIAAKLFPCTVLTLGGCIVDEETGQVLDHDHKAITGLYAAGRNAVGICSHHYVSGLSIADAVFSGRRAANHIKGIK